MATVEEVLAKIEGIGKKVPDDLCVKWPELCGKVDALITEVQGLKEGIAGAEPVQAVAISDIKEHIVGCPSCRSRLKLLTEEEAEEKFKPKEEPKPETPKLEQKVEPAPKPKPKVKVLKREELPASFSAYAAYGLEPEKQDDGTFILRDKGKFADRWGIKGEKSSIKWIPPGCSLQCEDPDKPESCKVVCED